MGEQQRLRPGRHEHPWPPFPRRSVFRSHRQPRSPPHQRPGPAPARKVESYLGPCCTAHPRKTAPQSITPPIPLAKQTKKNTVPAKKEKEEARLSTLRMVKSALQLKAVEKMG